MKFSVLIPAFKSDFLYEAITSVLQQNWENFELLVLNDCSPEDIDSIINSFHDSRLHYVINKKNIGAEQLVDNWNKLLSMSTGDYVMCIGDDDRLKPNCLTEYEQLIKSNPGYDIYHTRTELIDEKSTFLGYQEERPFWESVYSMIYYRWRGRRQFIGDFLFRTKALRDRGGSFIFLWHGEVMILLLI